MALTMIRRNQLGKDKQHSFFLISDTDFEAHNVPAKSIIAGLKSKSVKITNMALNAKGELVGTNGVLSRYPLVAFNSEKDIAENKPFARIVENPYNLVILGITQDGLYKVATLAGKVVDLKDSEVISILKQHVAVLANGSIVDDKFIRSINGTYKQYGESERSKLEKQHREEFNKVKEEKKKEFAANTEKVKAEAAGVKERASNIASNYKPESSIAVQGGSGDTVKVDAETARQLEEARARVRTYRKPNVHRIDTNNIDDELNSLKDDKSAISKVSGNNISIEEKLILASTTLKYIDPFVYAAYKSLDVHLLKEPEGNLATMGVSDDKIYIVASAIQNMELPKISWLLLHEISHIIMQHHARKGNRDHEMFNIACDLFINKAIDVNYGCKPGTPVQKMLYKNEAPIGLQFHAEVTDEKVVCSLFDDSIDITKDTAESIYAELMEENQEKLNKRDNASQQNGSNSGKGQGAGEAGSNQDGAGGDASGNSTGESGNGNGQEQGSGNFGDGKGQGASGGNNQGSGSSGQGNNQGSGNGSGNSGGDSLSGSGSGSGQGSGSGGSDDDYITFRGNRVTTLPRKDKNGNGEGGTGSGDMVEDGDSDSHGTTPEAKENWSRGFLKKIVQRSKTYSNTGADTPFGRMAQETLVEDFVWTNFVKQFLTKMSGEQYSYRNPNKKMMNHGLVMKGPVPLENNSEDNVYVCIDVSGSVSDTDLYKAFEYIRTLLKKLYLSGYVLFWSTEVDKPYKFKNSKDLIKVRNTQYKSTGGTDARCVFNYFKSRACKNKPNLVIMITDGYFSHVGKEYYPGCETLWILTDRERDYRKFDGCDFGKVAPLIPKK